MAIRVQVECDCPRCGKLIEHELYLTEGLDAKPEQMQSSVRQQDAALRPDESSGSAAGNPDGDSLEAFELWVEEQQRIMLDYIYLSNATEADLTIEEITAAMMAIQTYKRRGAA